MSVRYGLKGFIRSERYECELRDRIVALADEMGYDKRVQNKKKRQEKVTISVLSLPSDI